MPGLHEVVDPHHPEQEHDDADDDEEPGVGRQTGPEGHDSDEHDPGDHEHTLHLVSIAPRPWACTPPGVSVPPPTLTPW